MNDPYKILGVSPTATDDGSNDYIDIAYFAICDDWDEVAAVAVGEESVIFTAWCDAVNYSEVVKPDGTPINN